MNAITNEARARAIRTYRIMRRRPYQSAATRRANRGNSSNFIVNGQFGRVKQMPAGTMEPRFDGISLAPGEYHPRSNRHNRQRGGAVKATGPWKNQGPAAPNSADSSSQLFGDALAPIRVNRNRPGSN